MDTRRTFFSDPNSDSTVNNPGIQIQKKKSSHITTSSKGRSINGSTNYNSLVSTTTTTTTHRLNTSTTTTTTTHGTASTTSTTTTTTTHSITTSTTSTTTTISPTTTTTSTTTTTTTVSPIRINDELIVGTTAGLTASTSSYTNSSYIGWNLWLERVGSGTLFETQGPVDMNYDPNTGEISLTNGITFNNLERFIVHFYPKAQIASPIISSGRIITTDTTLTSDDLNTAIILQSNTSTLNITLPTNIPDWSRLYIYSMGGSHINASIICQGSDTIQYNSQVSQIILGQGETLQLYKAFGTLNVDGTLNGIEEVGEIFQSYSSSETNAYLLNGSIVSRLTYIRLWNWVQSNPSILIDQSLWPNSKKFFGTGDGSTTFQLPDLTGSVLNSISNIFIKI